MLYAAACLEKMLSMEEYEADAPPAKDMNLINAFLCCAGTYCRCCITNGPPLGWFDSAEGCNGQKAKPCFCGQKQAMICLCCEGESKCHLRVPKVAELLVCTAG